jgi:hypothetical protein
MRGQGNTTRSGAPNPPGRRSHDAIQHQGCSAAGQQIEVTLSNDSVDAIAQRVAELLQPHSAGLIDAATLANRLGVSRSTIYEHSTELCAIEVGEGTRPRLRFDPEKALAIWTRRSRARGSQPQQSHMQPGKRRPRKAAGNGSTPQLLPVRDRFAPARRSR